MESNRDEALRCVRLAEKYLADKDRERAEKFANKAMRLFPNERAKGQIQFLSKKSQISCSINPH